jgi:hypothetical protein
MTSRADQRADWLGEHYNFLMGRFKAQAHICPNDSFFALCGEECVNNPPRFDLGIRSCNPCRKEAESLAKEAIK